MHMANNSSPLEDKSFVPARPPYDSDHAEQTIHKTVVLSAIVIATNVFSNYALSRGLHNLSLNTWSPAPYMGAILHPWVGVGVLFMFGWFTSRLALLSWADLSYALPITSLSYALSALAGSFYLGEEVSPLHWAGIAVISLGVALVALTYPETTPPEGAEP